MNQLNALKEFFAGFLRARGLTRHFRRLLTLESVAQAGVSREVPGKKEHGRLRRAARVGNQGVLRSGKDYLRRRPRRPAAPTARRLAAPGVGTVMLVFATFS